MSKIIRVLSFNPHFPIDAPLGSLVNVDDDVAEHLLASGDAETPKDEDPALKGEIAGLPRGRRAKETAAGVGQAA